MTATSFCNHNHSSLASLIRVIVVICCCCCYYCLGLQCAVSIGAKAWSTANVHTTRGRGRPRATHYCAAQPSDAPLDHKDDERIVKFLKEAGYADRLLHLSSPSSTQASPIILEVFVNGQIVLATLVDISVPTTSKPTATSSSDPPPRLVVKLLPCALTNGKSFDTQQQLQTIDIGQVTTIWSTTDSRQFPTADDYHGLAALNQDNLDNPHNSRLLDQVYTHWVRKGRRSNQKKPSSSLLPAPTLKALSKTGPAYARLLDSALLSDYKMDKNSPKNHQPSNKHVAMLRAQAALLLGRRKDSRFKRWPSLLLTWTVVSPPPSDADTNRTPIITLTMINGGWLVVDQNVRAVTEARDLVERRSGATTETDNNLVDSQNQAAIDERIRYRLECLAMGQKESETTVDGSETNRGQKLLEKDVRETLRAMQLPLSVEGARQALVRLKWWTSSTHEQIRKQVLQPWPSHVLEAASWYASLDLLDTDGGRTNLQNLPAVCVDAQSTSFRDDAIGVRPRASTGRWIDESASKWEILIHITDVSDIYVPNQFSQAVDTKGHLYTLQEAAQNRGLSRYDLPLGPLHLLPPKVLRVLSFSDNWPQRCVTLWAYIDERNGKLLDAGFERSVVAPPTLLSYTAATELMESDDSNSSFSKDLSRARSVLLVAERNFCLWKSYRVSVSDAARRREERLALRVSEAASSTIWEEGADDGSAGFQHSRGHRLVDAYLELYSFVGQRLLRKAGLPFPFAAGGVRLATAPLRRYIDGQAQKQILAGLCSYGNPMTKEECRLEGERNNARNAVATANRTAK